MKIKLNQRPRGFVLLLVLVLAFFSLIILTGVMNRTSTVSLLNNRSTQLNVLDNAAEAAVEKVFARMAWDFQAYGPGQVTNNLGTYRSLVPSTTDNAYWGNFSFVNPSSGATNSIYVNYVTNYTGSLPTQFTNQFAYNSPIYRISCNTTTANSLVPGVVGTAQEDVLLALVPITTYAIFYNGQLEFTGCATMAISGRVHSNTNICVGAGGGSTLTFTDKVTCVAQLSAPTRATWSYTENDPTTWLTTFITPYVTNSPSVNIAIQMTNTHSLIDIPPAGESVMSQQGQVRLYNQAHVLLLITNSPLGGGPQVTITMQVPNNGSLPGADTSKYVRVLTNTSTTYFDTNSIIQLPFLQLDKQFVDYRQDTTKQQRVTEIDVNQYSDWVRTNSAVGSKFTGGNYPTILYVSDQRTVGTATQAVVRLSRATSLPRNNGLGFTVATQNPLYVWGNYNTTINSNTFASGVGTTTNGSSVPAALLCDAITILSPNWNDSTSADAFSSGTRNASSMTLNAALITGNVPSTGTGNTQFSGGVHNITRLLEDWSGDTLTMNTSIVVLYASQTATNQWRLPGGSSGVNPYYKPPTRLWGFDMTYYSPNKQPPGVPCALVPIRFNWNKPPPGSVTNGYAY